IIFIVCCLMMVFVVVFFFFQAEDGIRDRNVTGVQTCALPILACYEKYFEPLVMEEQIWTRLTFQKCAILEKFHLINPELTSIFRSEERRVGKECRFELSRCN